MALRAAATPVGDNANTQTVNMLFEHLLNFKDSYYFTFPKTLSIFSTFLVNLLLYKCVIILLFSSRS